MVQKCETQKEPGLKKTYPKSSYDSVTALNKYWSASTYSQSDMTCFSGVKAVLEQLTNIAIQNYNDLCMAAGFMTGLQSHEQVSGVFAFLSYITP